MLKRHSKRLRGNAKQVEKEIEPLAADISEQTDPEDGEEARNGGTISKTFFKRNEELKLLLKH